jgi:CAAX prenyl protease-like protein
MPAESQKLSCLRENPAGSRVIPFLAFVVLTFFQGYVPEPGQYWIYLAKLVVSGWLLLLARRAISELRWNLSWEAVAVGCGVFILWVGVDPLLQQLGWAASYPKLNLSGPPWNPPATFHSAPLAAWFFIGVRILGSSILVPMLEEVFFRSFLYRYIERVDFLSVPLSRFALRSFLITSVIFGFEHREWLAGILTGFAYQLLVCRKGRLGDAITAHAITNFLLGLWVVWKGAWQYW